MKFLLMKKPHSDALALDCLTGFLLVVQGWEIAGQRASMRYIALWPTMWDGACYLS